MEMKKVRHKEILKPEVDADDKRHAINRSGPNYMANRGERMSKNFIENN